METTSSTLPQVPVATFGKAILPLFAISPSNRSINFGSYGCPPRSILDKRMEHALRIDGNTEVYFRISGEEDVAHVRRAVADFIGLRNHNDVVLVDNAATAYNVIAQNILHNPVGVHSVVGREPSTAVKMLVLDRQYPMCKMTNAHWNSRAVAMAETIAALVTPPSSASIRFQCGFIDIDEMELSGEMARMCDATLVETLAHRVVTGAYHYFAVDHVCWSPAFVFPIVALCRRIRELESERRVSAAERCIVIVDGAHAVGNVDLRPVFEAQDAQLAASGGQVPLFDAYLSNFHKWLMVPKSASMLYVAPVWHRIVHPTVIGNNYVQSNPHNVDDGVTSSSSNSMQREFFCPGTRDHSCYLVVPDTIDFRRVVLGGEDRIRSYCFDLAYRAAQAMAQIWCSELVIHDEHRLCSMANVYCPPSMCMSDAQRVVQAVLTNYSCFGALGQLDGRPFVRVSAQVYHELEDFVHYAELFLAVAVKEGVVLPLPQ